MALLTFLFCILNFCVKADCLECALDILTHQNLLTFLKHIFLYFPCHLRYCWYPQAKWSNTMDKHSLCWPRPWRWITTDIFVYLLLIFYFPWVKWKFIAEQYIQKRLWYEKALFGLELIKFGTQTVKSQGCRLLPVSFKTKRNIKRSQTFEPSPWGFQKMIEAGTKRTLLLLGIRKDFNGIMTLIIEFKVTVVSVLMNSKYDSTKY